MRGRSSLLSHVLGSNPDICGYRELHRCYLTFDDLLEMREQLYREFGQNTKKKYLLDKILHNSHSISSAIFKIAKPKVIFLIREPGGTLKSLISMGNELNQDKYKNENHALEYYCKRLSHIKECARQLKGEYYFIESDDLLENTEHVLADLSNWLHLKQVLVKKYLIFKKTGLIGHGDWSDNLKSGTILKIKKDAHGNIFLSDKILEKAFVSYEDCKKTLLYYQKNK